MTKFVAIVGTCGALALAASMSACSSNGSTGTSTEDSGTLHVAMRVSRGLTIDKVSYDVSGNDFDRSGTFKAGNQGSFTGVVGGIPAGEGYTLKLSATAQPDDITCSGSAKFDVSAGQTSNVTIVLQCSNQDDQGSVSVNGRTDLCPVVDSVTAAPASAAAGESITVSASAHDDDDEGTLTYSWEADEGTFDDAASADTSYACGGSGAETLTLRVSDGAGCTSTTTIDVTCGGPASDAGSPADGGTRVDGGAGQGDAGAGVDAGGGAGSGSDAGAGSGSDAGSDGGQVGTPDAGGSTGGGSTGVTVPGTWIAQIQTAGAIEAPVVGSVNANIDLIVRILVTEAGGSLSERLEFCSLQTTSTPNASALAVTYPSAVVSTLSSEQSAPAFTANVGDPFPVPNFTVLSGLDSSGGSVDADMDGNPGVTLPTNIGGLLSLDAYVGLNISTQFSANVSAPDEVTGTTNFSVTGTVFGSNNPVLSTGNINVVPSSTAVPLTARRLDGDVPCSSVLSMF